MSDNIKNTVRKVIIAINELASRNGNGIKFT